MTSGPALIHLCSPAVDCRFQSLSPTALSACPCPSVAPHCPLVGMSPATCLTLVWLEFLISLCHMVFWALPTDFAILFSQSALPPAAYKPLIYKALATQEGANAPTTKMVKQSTPAASTSLYHSYAPDVVSCLDHKAWQPPSNLERSPRNPRPKVATCGNQSLKLCRPKHNLATGL